MNILVINGHPDKESFVSALFNKYIENLDKNKHKVYILELSSMKFDPVLRFGYRKRMEPDEEIEKSQELIKWANHIVFFYPIWFETVPSLLKGWFERVLTPGVAYNIDGLKLTRHLKGKTAHLIFTSLGPIILQKLTGNVELKSVKKVLSFCGLKITKVDRLGSVVGPLKKLNKREIFIEKICKRARDIK